MKTKFFAGLTTLALAAVLVSGCGKVPQVEIDGANKAIDEVKALHADIYLHDQYVALEDSMKAVMAGIEVQQSKFFKNFTAAKESLAGVTTFAQEVKQQTEERIEALKTEIQNNIGEVKVLLESNRQLILDAPKGKEGAMALDAIKSELATIETNLVEAGTLLENGDYLQALDKTVASKEKSIAINTELSEVIAKYKGKKGKKG